MSAPGIVHIFTFKRGLLSRVAHDLRLSLPGVEVDVDGGGVKAEVALSGLRVDGVMRSGRLERREISERDRASILKTAMDELLEVARFPVARFEGQRDAAGLSGRLRFHGRAVEVRIPVRGDRLRLDIQPSAWGIAPYKALMGAIQLQDRVRIEFPCPW